MSRDIRSFFTAGAKSKVSAAPTTPSPASNKRKTIVLESDSDDDSRQKDTRVANSKANSGKKDASKHKKRRIIESSDDDADEKPQKNQKRSLASKVAKLAMAENKLKPVSVSSVFGAEPIKRIEKPRKTPKKPNEKSLLENADDDDVLMNIDEALLSPKVIKMEAKSTPLKMEKSPEKIIRSESKNKSETKSPPKGHHRAHSSNNNKSPSDRIEKASPAKDAKHSANASNGHKHNESNRSKTDSEDKELEKRKKNVTPSSSKKPAKKASSPAEDLDLSVYDPDQERHERKRAAAMLYQKFQKRAGPSNPGSKEIPKGKPNCLAGMTFVLTGVFESMEKDEAAQVIKDFGGRVTSAVSGKTTHIVSGDDSGPAKLAKAEQMGIPILSEDDLFDLIREKSGLPTKSPKIKSPTKVDAKVEKKIKTEAVQIKKETHESPKKKLESPVKSVKIEREEKPSTSEIKVKQEPAKSPKEDVALAWVDKYKPKTIKDIIGQQGASSNCDKLVKWLNNWHKNNNGKAKAQRPNPWAKNDDGAFFKAALLSGPPGVGKTTTAQLVCQHLAFDTIEFNASDTRSKKLLQVEVSELLSNKTLHGYFNGSNSKLTEKQVLLMDEVDGMAGNEDRGGMQELMSLIKSSSVPIICMCNDRNHPKIRSLVNYCFDLRFARPRLEQIKGAIMSICFKENVKIPAKTIEEIIQATNNDIRQTVNSISMLSAKAALPDSKLRNDNGKKDLKLGPWEVVRKVFSAEEHKKMTINDKSDLFFHDYSLGPLFVQQNYLSVAPNVPRAKVIEQVALTADSLSLGDLVENRIRSRMAWSMLPVQAMYSSVLPGEYMAGHFTGQINFPGWLGKYSKTQKRSRLAQEIHDHTRLRTSGSRQSIRLDYAPFLLKNITQPLIDDKMDGVEEALSVMKEYRLLREDIDALVELTTWPGTKNPMDGVDGKVKAALTRAYNKEVAPYSYSIVAGVKKKKAIAGSDDDYLNELGDDGENGGALSSDDEDDDKVDNDVMIKAKKATRSTATATTSRNSKPSTSGRSGTKKATGASKKK